MQQFKNGNGSDRDIYIKVSDDVIEFYFVKDYDRHYEWLSQMEEDCIEVYEEDKEPSTFYYIMRKDWISDRGNRLDRDDNFHNHMRTKNWFTQEMYNYIESQTKN
jgi:hypothetical protein